MLIQISIRILTLILIGNETIYHFAGEKPLPVYGATEKNQVTIVIIVDIIIIIVIIIILIATKIS